jgi:hypothetical protein
MMDDVAAAMSAEGEEGVMATMIDGRRRGDRRQCRRIVVPFLTTLVI